MCLVRVGVPRVSWAVRYLDKLQWRAVGDDGHLLEEHHGGGESDLLLGKDSLTRPEEGHHPFTPSGSCRLAICLDILIDGWT